ncbi:transcription factor-like protein 23 [Elsinoe australis]|uniref:Transcription factor-like protein 23 n=1 Tax=Elsinoe australis TaxID=40998 RepID=A0A4U7AWW0_9PEZI|nr:transcription factor-like protein 23 [Elsinoe australis]
MEDLPGADSPPVNDNEMPEGNNDPADPLRPEIEEEDAAGTPPMANPQLDTETHEDDDEAAPVSEKEDDGDSDALSEVDEAQFEDFDPNAIAIDERRVVDASDVAMLGKHKRKRDEGEEGGKKKRKEGRREKPKKKRRDSDEGFDYGQQVDGPRRRKGGDGGEKKKRRSPSPDNDAFLTPEERKKKEFQRKLDEAFKKPKTSRRKAGIDLEAMADNELEEMRRRMAEAAQADTLAREAGKPAMHKLKMLPEVVALLNRNTLQSALVDPEINILESVRFFLEPLNDGSLPAYNIQRELFSCLAKLPISKDALVASGIGKVTHFYTRTPRAEASIKRQAERLVGEWTRPILKRSDDYRKREFVEAEYDPIQAVRASQMASQSSGADKEAKRAAARKAALAVPGTENRARVEGGVGTYTIVPRSDLSRVQGGVKRLGASGDEMFRKLKARHAGRGGAR